MSKGIGCPLTAYEMIPKHVLWEQNKEYGLICQKLRKEIEILRKYTDKYQAMFSYVPRGTQEFCEMTEEINKALTALTKEAT